MGAEAEGRERKRERQNDKRQCWMEVGRGEGQANQVKSAMAGVLSG